jgi:hypothetical protein
VTDRYRTVGAYLTLQVHEPLRLVLQVTVSGMAPARVEESLQVRCNGVPLEVTEVKIPGEGRVHLADPRPGSLTVTYEATVRGAARALAVTDADRVTYLRPSRYAESDRLAPIAQAEFAGISGGADLLAAVSSWVGSQLRYVPGSSGPTDGAVDTLLQRQGVCRDYAHLVIACFVPWAFPRGWRPYTRPACIRWTSTPSPKQQLTADGERSTPPCWRLERAWSASRRDATPRTRRSCQPTAVRPTWSGRKSPRSSTASCLPMT